MMTKIDLYDTDVYYEFIYCVSKPAHRCVQLSQLGRQGVVLVAGQLQHFGEVVADTMIMVYII